MIYAYILSSYLFISSTNTRRENSSTTSDISLDLYDLYIIPTLPNRDISLNRCTGLHKIMPQSS